MPNLFPQSHSENTKRTIKSADPHCLNSSWPPHHVRLPLSTNPIPASLVSQVSVVTCMVTMFKE